MLYYNIDDGTDVCHVTSSIIKHITPSQILIRPILETGICVFIIFVFLSMLFEYPYKLRVAYYRYKQIYLPYKVQKEYHFVILAYTLQ